MQISVILYNKLDQTKFMYNYKKPKDCYKNNKNLETKQLNS